MSAILTWICDECGHVQAKDVTSDAANGCKVFAGYPDGWYVGKLDRDACQNTTCQAAVQAHDHDLPDAEEQQEDAL